MESLRGQLLIAAPSLDDPNFARTVILVAHHDDDGAMGVVLNRPGDHVVGDAVPELADVVGDDEAVFVGGPVQPDGVMVLAEFEDPEAAALPLLGGLGFVALGRHGEHAPTARGARAPSPATPAGDPGSSRTSWTRRRGSPPSFVPEDAFTAEPRSALERRPDAQGRPLRAGCEDAARPQPQLMAKQRKRTKPQQKSDRADRLAAAPGLLRGTGPPGRRSTSSSSTRSSDRDHRRTCVPHPRRSTRSTA